MRSIKYTYLFPVAAADGRRSSQEAGDISDLLRAANSHLVSRGTVPPLRIVNSLLATGSADHGMSGGAQWVPFALSNDEFEEFVSFLNTAEGRAKFHHEGPVTVAEPPPEVHTDGDYLYWSLEEAMKDPTHPLNSSKRIARLADGRMVTSREFFEEMKRQQTDK